MWPVRAVGRKVAQGMIQRALRSQKSGMGTWP